MSYCPSSNDVIVTLFVNYRIISRVTGLMHIFRIQIFYNIIYFNFLLIEKYNLTQSDSFKVQLL